jgi:hypothetical protein
MTAAWVSAAELAGGDGQWYNLGRLNDGTLGRALGLLRADTAGVVERAGLARPPRTPRSWQIAA